MIDPMELAYHAARTNNVDDYDAAAYAVGFLEPNYPMPACIGFQHTKYGTYLFDTRKGWDGMPLFRGYTWEQWNS